MSNITDIKIDIDCPGVAAFIEKLLTECGGNKSLSTYDFEENLPEDKDERKNIWDWFHDIIFEGEVTDTDLDHSCETYEYSEEVGECKIDGKPFKIVVDGCWDYSPHCSFRETIDWTGWFLQIACTEIHNEENPLAGKASFARKPKIIEGFILDKNNVYKLCGFLTKQFLTKQIRCNFYPWDSKSKFEGYVTKSHTKVELYWKNPGKSGDIIFGSPWIDGKVGEIFWVQLKDNVYSIEHMDFKEFQKEYDLIEETK